MENLDGLSSEDYKRMIIAELAKAPADIVLVSELDGCR